MHRFTKSSQKDSRRLAKIHHRQAVRQRNLEWVTSLRCLAVQGFTAKCCLHKAQQTRKLGMSSLAGYIAESQNKLTYNYRTTHTEASN